GPPLFRQARALPNRRHVHRRSLQSPPLHRQLHPPQTRRSDRNRPGQITKSPSFSKTLSDSLPIADSGLTSATYSAPSFSSPLGERPGEGELTTRSLSLKRYTQKLWTV